jgi:hypothetical protein
MPHLQPEEHKEPIFPLFPPVAKPGRAEGIFARLSLKRGRDLSRTFDEEEPGAGADTLHRRAAESRRSILAVRKMN